MVVSFRHETNNTFTLLVGLEFWVDLVGPREVSESLIVAFKVLKQSSTVKEQVWVWLLHVHLSLSIRFDGELKLFSAFIVSEEVSQVRISQSIPALRILEVQRYCL